MPTYVYGCDACGHQFEKSQKFSDEPVRICPECQNSVRRIFQPAGIVFKGSGWHINDYKRNGGDASNGKNGSDTSAPKDGEAKTDSKPAEVKSEAKSEAAKTPAPSS